MQVGVVHPQNELRGDPSAVRRIGRAVEDLGFDHLLAYDHVLGAVHAEQDFRTRGARQEEQIELLRRLFTETVVDFSGRFHRVDRAALVPKPARPIPIWLGGSGDLAFDRAARLADGFIFFGAGGINHVVDAWQRLRDRVGGLGRSVEDFSADYVALSHGSVSELTAEIHAWREAGGTHVSIATMGRRRRAVGRGGRAPRGRRRWRSLGRRHEDEAEQFVLTAIGIAYLWAMEGDAFDHADALRRWKSRISRQCGKAGRRVRKNGLATGLGAQPGAVASAPEIVMRRLEACGVVPVRQPCVPTAQICRCRLSSLPCTESRRRGRRHGHAGIG